jgi:MFS transporter, DHA2 family, multidrug resistance protein
MVTLLFALLAGIVTVAAPCTLPVLPVLFGASIGHSRLVEQVIPSNSPYQSTLQEVTSYFTAHGSSLAQAHQQAIDWIGQQVQSQASFLAYMDAFWVLTLISLSAVPLALVLRRVKLGGPAAVAH